jgi:hypothetical protein
VIVRVQIVDLAIFILIGFYALWLLNFLKGLHPPEIQTAFSTPSLVVSLCPTATAAHRAQRRRADRAARILILPVAG